MRLPIPGAPGSAEFMAVYHAALEGHSGAKALPRGETFVADGTFGRLVHEYFASPDYRRLAPQTQSSYRNVIMRFLREENVSHRLVREMTRQHVLAIVSRRAETPGAANDLLKAERISQTGLAASCVAHGLRKAAARRLAEAGCSANEIAAITGHATLEEVARYTKAAEQKKLAHAAMNRLTHSTTGEFPNLREGLENSDKKKNRMKSN